MVSTVPVTTIRNTWTYLISRVNDMATLMTNKVMTVDATTTVGNCALQGVLTVNGDIRFTGNLLANGIIIATGAGFMFSATTTNTSPTVLDSFATTQQRTTKYIIQVQDTTVNGFQTTELLMIHDSANTFLTEYAMISSNGVLGTFDANVASGNVSLYFTATNSAAKAVKAIRFNIIP